MRQRTPEERIRHALVAGVAGAIVFDGATIWCVVYLHWNPLVVLAVLAAAFIIVLLDLVHLVRRYR